MCRKAITMFAVDAGILAVTTAVVFRARCYVGTHRGTVTAVEHTRTAKTWIHKLCVEHQHSTAISC